MARSRRRGGTNVAPPAEEPVSSNGSSRLRKSPGRSYGSHREWLLARHGSVCAYCGTRVPEETITLDHVRPRRGQSAYDRRDNLVLACKRCNTIKADKPFLVFLLAQRSRAERLLRYGDHLSDGIKDILRHMVGDLPPLPEVAPQTTSREQRPVFGPPDDDESPYREESPYLSA